MSQVHLSQKALLLLLVVAMAGCQEAAQPASPVAQDSATNPHPPLATIESPPVAAPTPPAVEQVPPTTGQSAPTIGQPPPPAPASPSSEVATEFAKRAAANTSKEALAMIDRPRFTERLMSPEGSYEAQTFQLKADQLLGMIGNYPLDGTTTFHNRRLWQVLGQSSFRGRQGIVLRYFSEPRSAIQVLSDPKRCKQVAQRIPFSEFEQRAGNLFAATERSAPSIKGIGGEIQLDTQVVPRSLGILPPRVGYLMLLVDDAGGTPVISDLVNLLSGEPLSATAGVAYKHEWTLTTARGKAHPGLDAKTFTFFGAAPRDLIEFTATNAFEDRRFRSGGTKQPPSRFGDRSDLRAIRLYEIAHSVRFTPAETAAKVKQFRTDFPNDTGADMAIVVVSMIEDKIYISPKAAPQVSESAALLHKAYNDPFLLAVQGLAEAARERYDVAREKLAAAHQGGFESVATHEFFVQDALRRDDTPALKTAVANLAKFWGNHKATRNEEVYNKYAARWAREERSQQSAEPSLADRNTGGHPPAGESGRNPGPRGGRIGPRDSASGRHPGDRPVGPGNGPPGERRQPTAPRGPMPTDPAAKVTIKLTVKGKFDLNSSVKQLREKVDIGGFTASQSGSTGSLVIGYAGPVKDVADAIDFGKVTSVDEGQRVIDVTVE